METITQTEGTQEARVFVSTRIPKSLDRKMELAIVARDATKQQFIEDALREKLEREAAAGI
jgi:hypothetical protein